MKQQASTDALKADAYRVLKQITTFKEWPNELLKKAADSCKMFDVGDGEEFIHVGQILDGLYVISSGTVMIGVFSADGRRYLRRYATSGQMYGILSLLDGRGSPQFYTSRGASQVIVVPRAVIFSALDQHPSLWLGLVKQMSVFHRNHLAAIHQLAFDPLRVRLLTVLLTHADQFCEIGMLQTQVKLLLTQDDIADLLGVTRQSVSRELKLLERAGHIQLVYGGLFIRKFSELAKLVQYIRQAEQ